MKFFKISALAIMAVLLFGGCENKSSNSTDSLSKANSTNNWMSKAVESSEFMSNMNDPSSYQSISLEPVSDTNKTLLLVKNRYRAKNVHNALILQQKYFVMDKTEKKVIISIDGDIGKTLKLMLALGKAGDTGIEEFFMMLGSSSGLFEAFQMADGNGEKGILELSTKISNLNKRSYGQLESSLKDSSIPNESLYMLVLMRSLPVLTTKAIVDSY